MDDFTKRLNEWIEKTDKTAPQLSYTDLIAVSIKEKLKLDKDMKVGNIEWDLHPEQGYYLSSKKTIEVLFNNKKYNITITEQ